MWAVVSIFRSKLLDRFRLSIWLLLLYGKERLRAYTVILYIQDEWIYLFLNSNMVYWIKFIYLCWVAFTTVTLVVVRWSYGTWLCIHSFTLTAITLVSAVLAKIQRYVHPDKIAVLNILTACCSCCNWQSSVRVEARPVTSVWPILQVPNASRY